MAEGSALLATHGLNGDPTLHQQIHQRYAGNPQWLSRATNLIYEFFDGDVGAFLQEGLFFFGDIGAILTQQLAQLSRLERQVLQQVAQATQPLTRQTLQGQLTPLPTKHDYFQALQSLQRAFLLEQAGLQVELPAPLVGYLAEHPL